MNSHSQKVIQENRDYTMFSWSVQATANPMHMKRAEGVWFWDGDDNRWLDFSSQLINLNVGHQHPKMLEAIKKQVDELCFAGPGFATDEPLVEKLITSADRRLAASSNEIRVRVEFS